MNTILILGMLLALGLGVYVGLGAPGFKGREDRVVDSARRLERRHIHWFRPTQRRR
jgi:hypothetical protein